MTALLKSPPHLLRDYSQFLVLLILLVFAYYVEPNFFTRFNLSSIAFQYSVIGIIALGQFLVIVSAGIDLSQGAVIGLTAVVAAMAIQLFGTPAGILLGLLTGASIGLINGLIVSFFRIQPFIATLGMMGVARGLALTLSGGQPVPLVDRTLTPLSRMRIAEIPATFLAFLVVAVLIGVFLANWPEGKRVYAIGGHEENARLSGLSINVVKLWVYSFSGLTAGVGGVLLTARLGTGHPLAGSNYELVSISAVIIGGASLFGGKGTIFGLVAAVVLLGTIDSLINLSGMSPYVQGTIKGTIVLAALALSLLGTKKVAAT